MRILILTEEQYPFLAGGGNTINLILEQYLKEQKVDYDIFCPRWKMGAKYNNSRINAYSLPLVIIKNKYLRQLYKIPYILSWYASSLFKILYSGKKYDVIFVEENTFSGYFSLFLKMVFGSKVVFGEQSPGDLSAIQNKLGLSNKSINFMENIVNNFRRRCDFIIYASRDAYKKYEHLNKKSEVIPNFIEVEKFTPRKPGKIIKNLGFCGRICYDKRIDVMIRAMEYLPQFNLHLIGKGPLEEEESLRKLASDLKLKNVFFRGYMDNSKVNSALDEIDIFLMLWEKESFGISALEAMAKGIPVIAADVQEMHYFIGQNKTGIVLKKINEKEVVKAVLKLAGNRKEYLKMSKRAQIVVKDYDYIKVLKQYLDVFRRVK